MSKRKSNSYTEEFKRSSARLAATSEQPISKTADEIGVHVTTLHGWVKKYEPSTIKSQSMPSADTMTEELKALKKENARLKQERDILKKAAAYFAEDAL